MTDYSDSEIALQILKLLFSDDTKTSTYAIKILTNLTVSILESRMRDDAPFESGDRLLTFEGVHFKLEVTVK